MLEILYHKSDSFITKTESETNSKKKKEKKNNLFLLGAEENEFMIFILVQNVDKRKATYLRNIPEI